MSSKIHTNQNLVKDMEPECIVRNAGIRPAKVGVVGSNPIARSRILRVRPGDKGNRSYPRHG